MSAIALFLSLVLVTSSPSAGNLMAQALVHLQKKENGRALKLLERAFEASQEPEEMRQIASLILEAAPTNYLKRENFLRYLIKFSSESADSWKWLKEMGDRSFDRAEFGEADDWYLRALAVSESDKSLMHYKLAWVRWNLKRRAEAARYFFESIQADQSGLRTQALKDLARLYWEMDSLPQDFLSKLQALEASDLKTFTSQVFELIPRTQAPTKETEASLKNLKTSEIFQAEWKEQVRSGKLVFSKRPCFMFEGLLDPTDEFPFEQLLTCGKSKSHSSPESLIPFFEQSPTERTEAFDRAYAELLNDLKKHSLAAQVLFSANLELRSKSHVEYAYKTLMQLDEKDFAELYSMIGREKMEWLQKFTKSQLLLERLTIVDPTLWLDYEEQMYAKMKLPPKSFLERKALFIADQTPPDLEKLEVLFQQICQSKLSPEEEKVRRAHKNLKELQLTKLPSQFSTEFKKKFDLWLEQVDRSAEILKDPPSQWQKLIGLLTSRSIEDNVKALLSQLEATTLSEELAELSETFTQKKEEIREQIEEKYSDYLKAGGDE